MMEALTKDLWVFVETNEDGTPKNVGLELLSLVEILLPSRVDSL